MSESLLDLVIVGAGPSGLAIAIAAHRAGLGYEVVEKGVLVNSIFHFPRQMTFFTTADLLEIGGLPFVSPYEKPTQGEALRYYRRVADTFGLHIAFEQEVISLRCDGASFAIVTRGAGGERTRHSRNVALATGYYDWPNRVGIPGEDLPHVSHYYGEPHPFYRKRVIVVGGKNSAAIAALELYRAGADVTLVHRQATLGAAVKYWIRPDIDNRIKEGAIRARFGTRVVEITPDEVVVATDAGQERLPADAVLLLTGYRPDVALMREAGVDVDARLMPKHDAQTLETNVPGLFVAGAVVAGEETGRIFIENGRFHGEQIVTAIAAGRS